MLGSRCCIYESKRHTKIWEHPPGYWVEQDIRELRSSLIHPLQQPAASHPKIITNIQHLSRQTRTHLTTSALFKYPTMKFMPILAVALLPMTAIAAPAADANPIAAAEADPVALAEPATSPVDTRDILKRTTQYCRIVGNDGPVACRNGPYSTATLITRLAVGSGAYYTCWKRGTVVGGNAYERFLDCKGVGLMGV